MRLDSSKFDLRAMNSGAISNTTALDLGHSLVPFIDELICAMPDNEASLEFRIRSIVNIMVISKLQSDNDRTELDEAKILLSDQAAFMKVEPTRVGNFDIINYGRWTIISLTEGASEESDILCDNLSEIFDEASQGKHFIFDFSKIKSIDFRLAAYLVGFHRMLEGSGRRMSLAWLPRNAITGFSSVIYDSIMSKFKLYKKGSFLLSYEAATA
jgi:hypothetical protein